MMMQSSKFAKLSSLFKRIVVIVFKVNTEVIFLILDPSQQNAKKWWSVIRFQRHIQKKNKEKKQAKIDNNFHVSTYNNIINQSNQILSAYPQTHTHTWYLSVSNTQILTVPAFIKSMVDGVGAVLDVDNENLWTSVLSTTITRTSTLLQTLSRRC